MSDSQFVTRSIELQTLTWIRDSNDLFDYEDPFLVKQNFTLPVTSKVMRISDLCIIREDSSCNVEDARNLGIVSMGYRGKGAAFLTGESEGQVWEVVRSMSRCVLDEGDVVKVGRVLLEVRQISIFGYDSPKVASTKFSVYSFTFHSEGERQACRICLSDTHTRKDPLISPCQCSGSVKFIHLNCLKEWLKSKLETSSSGKSMIYFWASPLCELCKGKFPLSICMNGVTESLISVHQPKNPFIVLQVTNLEPPEPEISIHVVGTSDNEIALIVMSI